MNRSRLTEFNADQRRQPIPRGLRTVAASGGGGGSVDPEAYIVRIGEGQTIYAAVGSWAAIKGVQLAAGTVVPPGLTPSVSGSYSAGITGGLLVKPDGTTATVWVAYQTSLGSPSLGSLPKDTPAKCWSKVALAYIAGGGATVDVYVVGAV